MEETTGRYLVLDSATYRCDLLLPILYFVSIEVAASTPLHVGGTDEVPTVKSSLLIVFLSVACAAQTLTLRIVPAHLDAIASIPNAIEFFCTHNYGSQDCLKDSTALRNALAPYPLELLGRWSFLLVPADDWRPLVLGLRQNPVSPAFSIIDQHITVLESSLLTSTPLRDKSLLQTFGVIGGALLDLAVTHELGHAICQDKDQRRADDYGRELRQKNTVECTQAPEGLSKIRSAFRESQADARQRRPGKPKR